MTRVKRFWNLEGGGGSSLIIHRGSEEGLNHSQLRRKVERERDGGGRGLVWEDQK